MTFTVDETWILPLAAGLIVFSMTAWMMYTLITHPRRLCLKCMEDTFCEKGQSRVWVCNICSKKIDREAVAYRMQLSMRVPNVKSKA
jgi:ribosomal protein L37AE/L43A